MSKTINYAGDVSHLLGDTIAAAVLTKDGSYRMADWTVVAVQYYKAHDKSVVTLELSNG